MNPHQRNKVDVSSMSPEEQKLFRLYGKLPNKKDLLQNKLKERKYFDSGDYALSKAGKASDVGVTQIGREHPNPESIPHSSLSSSPHNASTNSVTNGGVDGAAVQPRSSVSGGSSGSPVKEGSYLQKETSADGDEDEEGRAVKGRGSVEEEKLARTVSPPPAAQGVPIGERR